MGLNMRDRGTGMKPTKRRLQAAEGGFRGKQREAQSGLKNRGFHSAPPESLGSQYIQVGGVWGRISSLQPTTQCPQVPRAPSISVWSLQLHQPTRFSPWFTLIFDAARRAA